MKNLFLITLACLLGNVLSAQVLPGRSIPEIGETISMSSEKYEQYQLIAIQNKLLSNRRTALSLSIAGSVLGTVGAVLFNDNGEITDEGAVLVLVGGLTAAVGEVWLLVNEFKLIDNKRLLNERIMLELNPSGVRLRF